MKNPCLGPWIAQECPPHPGESLSEAVSRHKLAALNALLDHARRSPFYRKRLACVADMPDLASLGHLPFTTSADLTNWGTFLCVSQGEVARMVTLPTSGTTGVPKRLAFTEADLARTRAFFRAGMAQLVRAGDQVTVLLPSADRPNGVTDLLRQALPHARVNSANMDNVGTPDVLVLLPSQLRPVLAAAWPNLRGVLTSGEVLSDELRRESLTALPDCCFLDHYGLTESGFGGGVECPAHTGYHLREPDLVVEIVDAAGHVLPCGHWGEVVITTLHREAMPLIRYRTGDLSRLLSGPCVCGNPFVRLDRIRGRVNEQGQIVEATRKGMNGATTVLRSSAPVPSTAR